MKSPRVLVILWTVFLGTVCYGVERIKVTENFHTLWNEGMGSLVLTDSKNATTDFTTYTCSGSTKAKFFRDSSKTSNNLCAFLEESGAQVMTSEIESLDSLVIKYYPATDLEFYVDISPTGVDGTWTRQTVQQLPNAKCAVKLSTQGNFFVRIVRRNTNVYIREIEYHMVRCACFPYTAE